MRTFANRLAVRPVNRKRRRHVESILSVMLDAVAAVPDDAVLTNESA
jgi:hypothetical protein